MKQFCCSNCLYESFYDFKPTFEKNILDITMKMDLKNSPFSVIGPYFICAESIFFKKHTNSEMLYIPSELNIVLSINISHNSVRICVLNVGFLLILSWILVFAFD